MTVDDKRLLAFLGPQMRDYGGKFEAEPGVWVLFAIETADAESNKLALWLLAGAQFANHSALSEDEEWTLYYVDAAHRKEAIHWLDELARVASGQIRPVSPAQRSLIRELLTSGMPHRVAQQLAEQHTKGKLSAGSVQEPGEARALLDRMLSREPLFYSAVQTLLSHHLIDLIALQRQLIAEDLSLEDELGQATLSRAPFPQAGQIAADEIRSALIRFHIINPLEHGTNTVVTNPYAAYLEIVREDGKIMATASGNSLTLPREAFVTAIRSMRRNLYWGAPFQNVGSNAPWMRGEIAASFQFIQQRLESRRELSAMDGLYMLERAVEG